MKRNLKRLIAFASSVCLFCAGLSMPVVLGTAAWDETNQNGKFDSSTTTAGNLMNI